MPQSKEGEAATAGELMRMNPEARRRGTAFIKDKPRIAI